MIIPPDWLPWLTGLAAAFAVDQVRFGGHYTNMVLEKMSGNTPTVHLVRPTEYFEGLEVTKKEIIGRRDTPLSNGVVFPEYLVDYYDSQNGIHQAWWSDLMFSWNVDTRWNTGRIDIYRRSDELSAMKVKLAEMDFQLSTQKTKANMAWWNAMDFAVKMSSNMGEMKQNIGATIMVAGKGKGGVDTYSAEQKLTQEQEG